jgi:hypothetical protein
MQAVCDGVSEGCCVPEQPLITTSVDLARPRTAIRSATIALRTCLPRYQIFVPSTVFELALEPEKDPPVPDQYLHQLGCS